MKKEYNLVASEYLYSLDHKTRATGWNNIRSAYRERITRIDESNSSIVSSM